MKRFNILERVKEKTPVLYKLYSENQSDAYENVPGKEAFNDGLYTMANNAYLEGCYDLMSFLIHLSKTTPDIKLVDALEKVTTCSVLSKSKSC